MEIWKSISDADDYYEISDKGRVRVKEHIDIRGRRLKGHILAPAKNSVGYLQYKISYAGKIKKKYAHRLVAEAFIPNPDCLAEVDHIDDNRENNAVENLQWISHAENMRKMYDKNRREEKVVYFCACGETKYSNKSTMCLRCIHKLRREHIPKAYDLLKSLEDNNFNLEATGRQYGVTGNAVKKWCSSYTIDVSELKRARSIKVSAPGS